MNFERLRVALAERYLLRREIGAGGMATVYLADDPAHSRVVAIKVLRQDVVAVLGPERFLQEIRMAAGLHHPHLLPVYDSGEVGGFLYYVMPYVDGESLRDRLRREVQLPVRDAVRIADEVADGLAHAHGHGLVHRDIKPENILLEDGHALVADFGIARAIGTADDARLTETGLTLGTPGYMSPEQALGERQLGPRSDVFSLGCVLFEMLAGEPPFTGATVQASIARMLADPPPRISVLRNVSPHLEQTILTALARVPADRFGSAAELRDALREQQQGVVPAVAPPPGRVTRMPGRRAAGIGLALAGAAVVGVLLHRGRAPPAAPAPVASAEPAVAVLPFRALGPELEFWREGMADLLSFNLEGIEGLRKIDPATVVRTWRQLDGESSEAVEPRMALEVARQVHARYAVTGSAVRLGDAVRLVAEVHDAEGGDSRGSVQVGGPLDSVAQLVDRLTLELLRRNLLPAAGDSQSVSLSRATTTSLPALKAYLAGEREYRVGHFRGAVQAYLRAVELDSTFARAWYRLTWAAGWGGLEESEEYHRRMLKLAERLPERDRLLIEADFETLVRRYPDDVEGWAALGDRYFHAGGRALLPTSAYRDALGRALRLHPHFTEPYIHLVEDAFVRLDSAAARELVEGYAGLAPGEGCTLRLAFDLVWGADPARARALAALDTVSASAALWECVQAPLAASPRALDRLAAIYQSTVDTSSDQFTRKVALWRLLQVQVPHGQVSAAREALERAERMPETWRFAARWQLMLHLSGFPDTVAARRAAQRLAANPVPTDRFWIGALAVAERRWSDVARVNRDIRRVARGLPPGDHGDDDKVEAYAASLDAYMGLVRGDRGRLPEFQTAMGRLPALYPDLGEPFTVEQAQQYLRYRVGELLVSWGRMEDAERYFLTFGPYDYFYSSQAEYFLGQINEALERPERAASHYRRFVRWWGNADSALKGPWHTARERLARLAEEGAN